MSDVSSTIPAAGGGDPGAGGAGAGAAGGAAGSQPDFRTTIPEAYREKTYLRDAKSAEDVFKMLDNAQTLIGKQGKRVPADDAPIEEWNKFFNEAGRPETADKYEFKRADGVQVDPEVEKAVKGIFHEAGLSAKQAQAIQSKYDELMGKLQQDAQTKFEAEFDTLAKEMFGDKVDDELKASQELLAQLVPEPAKKFLGTLSNEAAIVLASVMREVRSKYVGEDKTRLNGGGGAGAGDLKDEAAIRKKGAELMATPEYRDPFHPQHEARKKEVADLYAKLNAKQ